MIFYVFENLHKSVPLKIIKLKRFSQDFFFFKFAEFVWVGSKFLGHLNGFFDIAIQYSLNQKSVTSYYDYQ